MLNYAVENLSKKLNKNKKKKTKTKGNKTEQLILDVVSRATLDGAVFSILF